MHADVLEFHAGEGKVEDLLADDPGQLGSYQLLGRLGSGGMGVVFLGQSPGGRPVAIKVIRAELAADPGFRSRFAREVAAARAVHGLFTALVVDADVEGSPPWLATAYVPGPSLAAAITESGPLPAESVRALAAGLAEGLVAIGAAGIVHRDLKPSNVLLAHDGPRVIDFGISRAAEGTALTGTGGIVGTPGFMSPEQVEGGDIGAASDIFSLGAVLVFAATGEGPFGTGNTMAMLYRAVHNTPDLSKVPAQIRPLIGRCLAKDPATRPDADQLLAELGAAQQTPNWLPPAIAGTLARHDLPDQVQPPAAQRPKTEPARSRFKARDMSVVHQLEAEEMYPYLGNVQTASDLARKLSSLRRERDRARSPQLLTMPAATDPAAFDAVGAGKVIPDDELLDFYLITYGVRPEHLGPWHSALDRVSASVLYIEYRARAIELARALDEQVKILARQNKARTRTRARAGRLDPAGLNRHAEYGRLNGLASALEEGLDDIETRINGDQFNSGLPPRIRHIGGEYDIDEASENAVELVRELAAVRVDACGVDLTSLHIAIPDAAADVTWTEHTRWPADINSQIRQRSREIRPGIFQVF